MKKARPQKNDNSWLGNMGLTKARLYNNDEIIGECLDTSNCVACAFAINNNITKAVGICGEYDIKDIKNRMNWILQFRNIHEVNIWMK